MKRLLTMVFLSLLACRQAPLQEDLRIQSQEMQNIVLLHGLYVNSSVWDDLRKELPKNWQVQALDLPGRRPSRDLSYQQMAKLLCPLINKSSVVVAHGFGGMVTNAMVGICPGNIQKIIYISGLVALPGETLQSIESEVDMQNIQRLVRHFGARTFPIAAPDFVAALDPSMQKSIQLHSESIRVGTGKMEFDAAQFIKIQKYYIFTSNDPLLSKKSQMNMAAKINLEKTTHIESGHLPMITNTKELATTLVRLLQ